MAYHRYGLSGGPQSPSRAMPPTPAMLSRENDVLAADNAALVMEQRRLTTGAVSARQYAGDYSQRNVILGDEMHSAHRALAAANDEKNVLVREKAELSSANKIMMQRINKLETMTKGREDSVREIGRVLSELRKVKSDLQVDNNSLKKQLHDKESVLQTLETEAVHHNQRASGLGSPLSSPTTGNISPRQTTTEIRQNLQQRLRFLENVNKSLQTDNVSLNTSLDALQHSITSLRASKIQDMEEIDALTRDLEVERRNNAALDFSLKQSMEAVQLRGQELEESKKETRDVKSELTHQTGPEGTLPQEVSQLEKKQREMTRLLTNVQEELSNCEEQLRTCKETLRCATNENGVLKAELEVAGSKSSSAASQWESDAMALKDQLQEARQAHEQEITALREKMNEPGVHMATTEGKITSMEATIAAQATSIENKDTSLIDGRAKTAKLVAELKFEKELNERHVAGNEEAGRVARDLSEAKARLEAEVSRLTGECAGHEDTVQHLKVKAQQVVAGNQEVEQRTAELEEKLERLREREKEVEQMEGRAKARCQELAMKEEQVVAEGEMLRVKEGDVVRQQEERDGLEIRILRQEMMEKEAERELLMASGVRAEREVDRLKGVVDGLTKDLTDANFYRVRELAREDAPTPVTAAEELGRMEGIIDRLQGEKEALQRELDSVVAVGPVYQGIDGVEDVRREARRDLCNAQAKERELLGQLEEAKARLGESAGEQRKSGKGHKLELWQAEQLVTSWNIEVTRFLKFSERLRSTNQGLEAQLMTLHDRAATSAPVKPKSTTVASLAVACISYTTVTLLVATSLLFLYDVAMNPALFEETTLHTILSSITTTMEVDVEEA